MPGRPVGACAVPTAKATNGTTMHIVTTRLGRSPMRCSDQRNPAAPAATASHHATRSGCGQARAPSGPSQERQSWRTDRRSPPGSLRQRRRRAHQTPPRAPRPTGPMQDRRGCPWRDRRGGSTRRGGRGGNERPPRRLGSGGGNPNRSSACGGRADNWARPRGYAPGFSSGRSRSAGGPSWTSRSPKARKRATASSGTSPARRARLALISV